MLENPSCLIDFAGPLSPVPPNPSNVDGKKTRAVCLFEFCTQSPEEPRARPSSLSGNKCSSNTQRHQHREDTRILPKKKKKKNTPRAGDGNPHQNYFYIQVSETNTCSGGSDCSVATQLLRPLSGRRALEEHNGSAVASQSPSLGQLETATPARHIQARQFVFGTKLHTLRTRSRTSSWEVHASEPRIPETRYCSLRIQTTRVVAIAA